jgi:hypothetical protein
MQTRAFANVLPIELLPSPFGFTKKGLMLTLPAGIKPIYHVSDF